MNVTSTVTYSVAGSGSGHGHSDVVADAIEQAWIVLYAFGHLMGVDSERVRVDVELDMSALDPNN